MAANEVNSELESDKTKEDSSGGGSISNIGKVKIIADEANNSIIIVASAQDYDVVVPVITQLDVMPLQVLIDATVVSVTLSNELKYGISWYLAHNGVAGGSISTPPGSGGTSLTAVSAQAAAAAATGGLSTLYTSGAIQALLNAQATASNVNVISSPSLMVLNNQKAKINVGQQIPIQTGTTSAPGLGGLSTSNSIQYKDTGVTLEVTPRVNANGMVIMKLSQIVSKPISTTIGVTATATIDKKEINSSVAVQDGETIVLGGLIDETSDNSKNGIPWLNDVPVIGPLFSGTDKKNNKQELVVLITPRVVKSKQDSRVISAEFKRKLTGIYQGMDRQLPVSPK